MKHLVLKSDIVKLDELAVEKYNHSIYQMLELAGYNSARIIKKRYPLTKYPKVLFAIGGGKNGAGGLSVAKHLQNWGYEAEIFLTTTKLNNQVEHFLTTSEATKIKQVKHIDPTQKDHDLIFDAIMGYGIRGDLRSPVVEYVASINETGLPVVSLDTPSGLSIDTGRPSDIAIRAKLTIMIAAEKQGLYAAHAQEYVGELELIDVGIPKSAYDDLDLIYPWNRKIN